MYRCDNCNRTFVGSPSVVYSYRHCEDEECENEKRVRFDRSINRHVLYFRQTVKWEEPESEKHVCPVCAELPSGVLLETQTYCACTPGNIVPSELTEQDHAYYGGFSASIGFGQPDGPVAQKLMSLGANPKNAGIRLSTNPCSQCSKKAHKSNGRVIYALPQREEGEIGTIRDLWSRELMIIERHVALKVKEVKELTQHIIEVEINNEILQGKRSQMDEKDLKTEIRQRMPSDDELMLKYVKYDTLLRFAELKCFLGIEDNWLLRNLLNRSFYITRVDLGNDEEPAYVWTKLAVEEYRQWKQWYYAGIATTRSREMILNFDLADDADDGLTHIERYNMRRWKRYYEDRKEELFDKTWNYRTKKWEEESEDYRPRRRYFRDEEDEE